MPMLTIVKYEEKWRLNGECISYHICVHILVATLLT